MKICEASVENLILSIINEADSQMAAAVGPTIPSQVYDGITQGTQGFYFKFVIQAGTKKEIGNWVHSA